MASEEFLAPDTSPPPRGGRPPVMTIRSTTTSSISLRRPLRLMRRLRRQFRLDVGANQFLQKNDPVDLPDHRARILVARDVRRVPGEQVPHDLINGTVPLLRQGLVGVAEDLLRVPDRRRAQAEDPGAFVFAHGSTSRHRLSTQNPCTLRTRRPACASAGRRDRSMWRARPCAWRREACRSADRHPPPPAQPGARRRVRLRGPTLERPASGRAGSPGRAAAPPAASETPPAAPDVAWPEREFRPRTDSRCRPRPPGAAAVASAPPAGASEWHGIAPGERPRRGVPRRSAAGARSRGPRWPAGGPCGRTGAGPRTAGLIRQSPGRPWCEDVGAGGGA